MVSILLHLHRSIPVDGSWWIFSHIIILLSLVPVFVAYGLPHDIHDIHIFSVLQLQKSINKCSRKYMRVILHLLCWILLDCLLRFLGWSNSTNLWDCNQKKQLPFPAWLSPTNAQGCDYGLPTRQQAGCSSTDLVLFCHFDEDARKQRTTWFSL